MENQPISYDENELKEFWEKWLVSHEPDENDNNWYERSVYDLVKVAVDNEQFVRGSEFSEVKRVVKFRIKMPRDAMNKTLGINTYSIYGLGLFTVVDGVFMSPSSRDKSGYDKVGRKRYFDLSFVPSVIKETYEFSLAVPALGGLFIPKKSRLTSWMNSISQIQYFDLTIND